MLGPTGGLMNIKVAVICGSASDKGLMQTTLDVLEKLEIPADLFVSSAHRDPAGTARLVQRLDAGGVQVFIAAAGLAAALPGFVAAYTQKPVIGVPVDAGSLGGLDALLSMVQMPRGVPVATVAIGKHGAYNAAVMAGRILALGNNGLYKALEGLIRPK